MIGYGETNSAMYEAAPKELYSRAAKANMMVLLEISVKWPSGILASTGYSMMVVDKENRIVVLLDAINQNRGFILSNAAGTLLGSAAVRVAPLRRRRTRCH